MTANVADSDPLAAAERVVEELISAAHAGKERARLTRAPAGAGKTGAVVRLVGSLGQDGRTVGVITQTNEQAFDIVERLSVQHPSLEVAFMPASSVVAPEAVSAASSVSIIKAADIASHAVVVATGHKWAYTAPQLDDACFTHGVVDEMYQMSSAMLLRTSRLFAELDGLGDPGQLDPFTPVDDERWAGHASDPTLNAVDALLAHHTDVRIDSLPITRRLSPAAAAVVGDAFYPDLKFGAASTPDQRTLTLTKPKGRKPIVTCLEAAAATGWGLLELPEKATRRTDGEVAAALAELAKVLLAAKAQVRDEKLGDGLHRLSGARIAIGVAHNDQKRAVRIELEDRGIEDVVVDTANRLQGREFDVTLVWHPLSGRADASEFHLDCGRLCVLATRHRHACVIVTRAGVEDILADHPPPGSLRLGIRKDRTFDGWEAHRELLQRLAEHRVSS